MSLNETHSIATNLIESEHEKPLVMRILFGGNDKPTTTPTVPAPTVPTPTVPTPTVEKIQVGGKKKISFKFGGGDPKQVLSDALYFRKLNKLFIILFLSIILSVYMAGIFINMIFKDSSEPDSEFELEEIDYKARWKRIITLVIIFIVLIIISHFLIYCIIVLFYSIKYGLTNDDPNANVFKMALEKLKSIIWIYTDDAGNEVGLIGYYMLLFLVLIFMFVFFMIYTLLVKGYLKNVLYEKVYNPKKPDVEDRRQPQKFLIQYAVYILVMMLFVLLLLNYSKLLDKKIIFIYNIIFVIFYIIFTINILRYLLQRSIIKFSIFIGILLLFALFLYDFILKNMAKFLPS